MQRLAQAWGWWVGTPGEVAAGFQRAAFQVCDAEDLGAVEAVAEAVGL